MTVELRDSDGTIRLSGDLLASGGATGDVLTQQADGTYSPAPGGGSQPFTPTDLTSLQLWLDASTLALADDAPVATWPDASGNDFDAVQAVANNQPVCKTNVQNGLRVVRFDPAVHDRYLTIPSAVALFRDIPSVTIASVVRGSAAAEGGKLSVGVAVGVNPVCSYDSTVADHVMDLLNDYSDGLNVSNGRSTSSSADVALSGVLSADVAHIASAAVSTNMEGYSNNYTATPDDTPDADTDPPVIGADFVNFTGIKGDLCELIVCVPAVSARQAREIFEYLSAKWDTL